MQKVKISIDDFLVIDQDRKDLVKILKQRGDIEIEYSEHDTHAMGGMAWFPTDLIIEIVGLTIAGFFGAIGGEVYQQLKNKVKEILNHEATIDNPGIDWVFFVCEVEGKKVYFEFDKHLIDSYDIAFEKMLSDFPSIVQELIKFFEFGPKRLFGDFSSVTFVFDWEENHWVLAHLNK